jgi:hypothetical protein
MLAIQMDIANTPPIRLVVCGGASLIATKVISQTTRDRMMVQDLLRIIGYESVATRL